ncbi:hypothetical protein BTN50_1337 [Candidatus Enterovibrio altilux]|uniref:Mobile element protein n=2 Tax=Candidatus Enterovibrio altilux TaxID=1927128 RepID=A0A291BA03_9GAMM|nr:hypothetical protein BTN50_1337 [Candidatus Enterovibrio luxaltus]
MVKCVFSMPLRGLQGFLLFANLLNYHCHLLTISCIHKRAKQLTSHLKQKIKKLFIS